MRTTVTLDEDVFAALKQRARDGDVPFKRVLNEAIRAGLNGPVRPQRPYRQTTSNMGLRPGVDLTKALQLSGELEDEEIIRKLREGG